MRNRRRTKWGVVISVVFLAIGLTLRGIVPPASADAPTTQRADAKPDAFDVIRGLAGTWVSDQKMGKNPKPLSLVFRSVSMDSAVEETLFPGTDHEMIDMYTVDGDDVVLTHYCAMGNQPHMRLASMNDGVLQFEFVTGGNMTSRNEMHMDSLQITIKGDHLAEKWGMYHDGKVSQYETFEFKRQG